MVTVDVKGNWQRWLKVRDLTKGVTYSFRVQARTIAYGPELQANVTAGPADGKWPRRQLAVSPSAWASRVAVEVLRGFRAQRRTRMRHTLGLCDSTDVSKRTRHRGLLRAGLLNGRERILGADACAV